jgi:hypothetical protein
MNEWLVAVAFVVFIGALLWVTVEAVTHGKKSKKSREDNPTELPSANRHR